MSKTLFCLFFICAVATAFAQSDVLVLKKDNQTIQYFYTNSYISFQLANREWVKGFITRIENDSFYFTKEIIRYYPMGSDTTRFAGYHYGLSDVFAVPKKGVQIDYRNNAFNITGVGGHVHWYWLKSGWLFRATALGYAVLNVTNGLIKNNFSFTDAKLGVAAGVFAAGVILKKTYHLTLRLGKKYHLETLKMKR